jgi:hypothetical protein
MEALTCVLPLLPLAARADNDSPNLVEMEAGSRHDAILPKLQDPLAAKMRRVYTVPGSAQEVHGSLVLPHFGKIGNPKRHTGERSTFHVDGYKGDILAFEGFLDLYQHAGHDELVAIGIGRHACFKTDVSADDYVLCPLSAFSKGHR